MTQYLIVGSLAVAALIFAVLALLMAMCNEKRVESAVRFLRNRCFGGILAAGALAWCAPQIQSVAWHSLAPWVWPLCGLAFILSVIYLDNLAVRAFAGLLILGAYFFLDVSFDYKFGMYAAGALPAWVWGAIGIVIAAKPCYLRDFLQLGAGKSFWRYLAAALSGVTALFLLSSIYFFFKAQG